MKGVLTAILVPCFLFLLVAKLHQREHQRLVEIAHAVKAAKRPEPLPPAPAPEGSYDDPDYQLGGEKTAFRYITDDEPAVAEIPGEPLMLIRFGNSILISR